MVPKSIKRRNLSLTTGLASLALLIAVMFGPDARAAISVINKLIVADMPTTVPVSQTTSIVTGEHNPLSVAVTFTDSSVSGVNSQRTVSLILTTSTIEGEIAEGEASREQVTPSANATSPIDKDAQRLAGPLVPLPEMTVQPPVTTEIVQIAGLIEFDQTGDSDGDDIPDVLDVCPDDPEDFDGFQDEDGCPEPLGKDEWMDLGDPDDEQNHGLKGWGIGFTPPTPSPSGDSTARLLNAPAFSSFEVTVPEVHQAYDVSIEVGRGQCVSSFQLFVNRLTAGSDDWVGLDSQGAWQKRDISSGFGLNTVGQARARVPATTTWSHWGESDMLHLTIPPHLVHAKTITIEFETGHLDCLLVPWVYNVRLQKNTG